MLFSLGAARVLLRTLAGLEDFARVNSHYARRELHRGLAERSLQRDCLFCIHKSGYPHLDSEWHSVFDCSLHAKAREEFLISTSLHRFFHVDSSVIRFAELIVFIRKDPVLVGAFARFLYQIQFSRQKMYRFLSTAGLRAQLAGKIELMDVI